MIGIYKITSPSKKIYIGQSVNIEKRFKQYKLGNCKRQKKLYNSFKKYGAENHVFTVIIECEIIELNDKERYYQDLYSVLEITGLNCLLTNASDRSGKLSKETIIKMSLVQKNIFLIKRPIEINKKQGLSLSKNKSNNERLLLFNENRKVKIGVYDYDTEVLLSKFNSIRECARIMNIDRKSISLSCKNIYPYAYGFIFKYL